MRPTKHIFIEGISGSGKSTTAKILTDYLSQQQIPVRFLPEGGRGHPVRVAAYLLYPFQIWRDVTADEFIRASLRKWRSFVNAARQSDAVTVCDGQLFHGNLMDLLLLNAKPNVLRRYVTEVISLLSELHPVLIYFYQADVAQALQKVAAARGVDWITLQAQWKLPSPYGRERGLAQLTAPQVQPLPELADPLPIHVPGFVGLIYLFNAYRALSDTIVAELPIPTLQIDNTEGKWPEYLHNILNFLELPPKVGNGFRR